MTWPVIIELLLQMLIGSIDQVMLSKYSATAVAAVYNKNQIMNPLILSLDVIRLAVTIMFAHFLSAKGAQKARYIYILSVGLNLIISLLISTLLFIFLNSLVELMKIPPDVRTEAKNYLIITTLSLSCQELMLTFSDFLRTYAKILIITVSTGIINLNNIVGNTILIYGVGPFPSLEAFGAAISTAICRTLEILFVMLAFFKSVPDASISLGNMQPFPGKLLKRLLCIGLPLTKQMPRQ